MNMIRVFLLFLLVTISYSQDESPLPGNSSQLIIVVTESISSTQGLLFYFEYEGNWKPVKASLPVALGKGGLGWGNGLHKFVPEDFPLKKEGDGKSPAGMFRLSSAFGFEPPEKMKKLKVPYLHITEMLECIDDTESAYYNDVVYRDSVVKVDWRFSEKMYLYGRWYEQGVIIEHNKDPEIKAAGSCIFLHNWASADETSNGCTEMEPDNLKELIYWLDSSKNPVLVQLPKSLYVKLRGKWKLPKI